MKWLSVFSGFLSGIFLVDMISCLVSGVGICEIVSGGSSSPLVISIASHLTVIPDWAFYLVCAISIVVLSALMSLCIVSAMSPSKYRKGRFT